MAKRKTPKSEKVVDLKPNKITDEQLKEIQAIVNYSNQVRMEVGNIEAKKHALLHELDNANQKVNELSTILKEQYGDVDVNIQTGEIKYKEDEQADS